MASSVQKSKNYFEWKWWRWRSVNKIAKNIVSILFCHNCGFTSTKCTMIWPQSPDDYLPVSVSLTSYEFQWIVSFFTFHIFGWKTRNSIFFRWSKSFCERVLIAAEKKLAKQEISILEMMKISDDCMNISQLLGACNNNDIFVLNYWKCESEHTYKYMTMRINVNIAVVEQKHENSWDYFHIHRKYKINMSIEKNHFHFSLFFRHSPILLL